MKKQIHLDSKIINCVYFSSLGIYFLFGKPNKLIINNVKETKWCFRYNITKIEGILTENTVTKNMFEKRIILPISSYNSWAKEQMCVVCTTAQV